MADTTTGRRILEEIDEASLDEILTALRTSLNSTSTHQPWASTALPTNHSGHATPSVAKVKSYPIQVLDSLVTRHFRATQSAPLSLSGRHLPLAYLLVATLLSSPHNKAVVIIDIDAKFDVSRILQCVPPRSTPIPDGTATASLPPEHGTPADYTVEGSSPHEDSTTATHNEPVNIEDLKHLYVYRPARGTVSDIHDVLAAAERHMVYSRHASVAREWWGTIVIGGGSPTALGSSLVNVTTGWKGWLRVDREEVRGFPVGMSVEEALIDRHQRQRAADAARFTATCAWGGFTFDDKSGSVGHHYN